MRGAIAKKSTVEGEWRPAFKDRDGAWTIQLNKDPETGGRTLAVRYTKGWEVDRKSTRLNSSHIQKSRMPSSA